MSKRTVVGRLGSAVADAGTFTVSYPAPIAPALAVGALDEGAFYLAMGHKLVMAQTILSYPDDFDITLGTSDITVTNKTGASWPANSDYVLELQEQGKAVYADVEGTDSTGKRMNRMTRADSFLINLGAPDTSDDDAVVTATDIAAAGDYTLNGAAVSGGVATFDVPRNVIITSAADDSALTFTVTGKDEYGQTLKETITGANAGIAAGKKAFKQVSVVSVSGNAGSVKVGFGDVLGLPVFLPSAGNILKELQDGAVATAGTVVAGIRTAGGSTATTGDVRGTYDPNAAADGARVFQLIVALPDPGYRGIDQYAG
jgi:hypothetical protein